MDDAARRIWCVAICSAWLALVPRAATARGGDPAALDVPYLPQDERLCGGAAAAMIFRYWGERHADARPFAPLVDKRAGGIHVDRLTAAIAERGWLTERASGSLESLAADLRRGYPLLVLIEVRPTRYHFVVAIEAGPDRIVVHDPAVGPSRTYSTAAFAKAWAPTGNWALRVRPDASRPPSGAEQAARRSTDGSLQTDSLASFDAQCDRALSAAVDGVRTRGFAFADELFGAVHHRCPTRSGAVSELAGVRLAQRRFTEAATLAAQATRLDRTDAYAWDVLGASRFLRDDQRGALEAWNAIGKPRVDTVAITGLTLTHHALVAEWLGLDPNTILTGEGFNRAERRLADLPTRSTARLSIEPDGEGWTVVKAGLVERARRPQGWFQWASLATESLVRRELTTAVPGWGGHGDLWTASWRFWPNRPRVALGYSAPRTGRIPGVISVEAAHGSQTYATDSADRRVIQRHLRGGLSLGHWITSTARYEVSGGVDRWDDSRTAVSAGLSLDRRFLADRVALTLAGRQWWPLDGTSSFGSATLRALWRTSTAHGGSVALVSGGYAAVAKDTPLTEWPGAGDQSVGSPFLRAHPLTHGGIVDGVGFGRRLASATVEGRRWLERPSLVRLGVAAFLDAAQVGDTLRPAIGRRLSVDLGVGVRVRVPGREGVIRLDYARGVRDGANAVTLGYAP